MSPRAMVLLVRRSLAQHALSTGVTVAAMALAAGLVMAVFAIEQQTRDAFASSDVGYDAVLGARGSELQLVLNTVFHLDTSPGNIPWSLYQEVKNDRTVKYAIPYAVGDNYKGFRVVGTTNEIFTEWEYREGKKLAFDEGTMFDPELRQAVVGSFVAQQTGLRRGSRIHVYHGITFDERTQHEGAFDVCGVLAPTNTPADRVVWIPIDGIFMLDGHRLRGAGEEYEPVRGTRIPDEHKEIGAVMIKFHGSDRNRGVLGMQLQQRVKQGRVATLAWPIANSLGKLFDKLGWMTDVLRLVAYLVVVVAVGAVLASIYNTMNERRREFAILRALGARAATVFGAIVLESTTIAALGAILGFVVYGVILAVATSLVRTRTGVVLDAFVLHPVLWKTPAGMILLGAVAGLLPARKAYATDVAENLAPAT